MYSKAAAVTVYMLAGLLDFEYVLWVAAWSSIGSLIGLSGLNWYMKKFNR
jgi:hypothetical protein